MAANAIGKISFQVVADTSRVDRNLGESAKSFQRYATAINRTISGASAGAAKQFNAILTPLQRLNEALNQGTGRLQFRGLEQSRQQIEQLALASREVAKPLADVAKSFDSLSLGVQGAFIPSLVAAQDQVRNLESAITSGKGAAEIEKQFARASVAVQKTAAAVSRLNEVQRLSGSLATGRELQFTDPSFAQRLNAAAAASSRAVSSPASLISANPQIAALTTQLGNAVEEAARLQAKLEDARLTGLRQDITAAEAKLSSAEQTVERLTNRLNSATAAPGIAAASGRLNILSQQDLQDDARLAASREIGADIPLATRQLDQLYQRVQGVRGQIDSLPATIGTEFIPQLQRAEQEFINLRASGRATAEEIENAGNNVDQLAAQVRRVDAAQGLGSFADGLSDTALRGAIGSLQALQQILNRVGATAGSEAAVQFDRMRAAIQRATREGTIGSEAFQRELRQIAQEAANAAAATGRIGRGTAFREIQRGGDIARGGFDKLSLATQQAAFAIDDFFSATGDFTQKIRAVQNNVTQLAFILGGTKGLFIGLGVAIAAQAAVALFKWSQGTVDAEDKTQALNDALARQKSLVEELKQSFESLGDAVSRGLLDADTQRLREIAELADDVRRKAGESAVERISSLDPIVQQQRAARVGLERQLGEETDTASRIRLQREIDVTRRREDRRVQSIREREPVTQDEATQRVLEGFSRILEGRLADLQGVSDAQLERTRAAADVDLQGLRQRLEGVGSAQDAIDALDERISELSRQRGDLPDSFGLRREGKAIDDEIVELTRTIAELERTIDEGSASLRSELLESSGSVRDSLVRSGRIIEESLNGFGPIAEIQRNLAERLSLIQNELKSGRAAGADGRVTQDDRALTDEEIAQRRAILERLNAESLQIEATTRSAEALEQAFRRLADQLAETVRQEAAADVERTRRAANAAEARMVSTDSIRAVAERAFDERRIIPAERAEGVREDVARLRQVVREFADSQLEGSEEGLKDSDIRILRRFQEGEGNLASNALEVERIAEKLRENEAAKAAEDLFSQAFDLEQLDSQKAVRTSFEGFDGSVESARAISKAVKDSTFYELEGAADIFLQKVRDLNLDRAVAAFEEQIALDGQARIEELDRQRQEFQTQAQEEFQNAARRGQDPAGVADLVKQRDQLLSVQNRTADQESQLRTVTDKIQRAFDQSDAGRQAARLADEVDIERQRQVQAREQRDAVRASAIRGEDLVITNEERLRRQVASQFEDAQNAVLRSLIEPLREVDEAGVAQEIEDGILSLQELATIFKRSPELKDQLDGEIQGAIEKLQIARNNITGNISEQIAQFDAERAKPSRAALQAQDINTQQGRAELNRLLRGDDANRDQPVLQGIKEQTAVLKTIDSRIDQVRQAVGLAGI